MKLEKINELVNENFANAQKVLRRLNVISSNYMTKNRSSDILSAIQKLEKNDIDNLRMLLSKLISKV